MRAQTADRGRGNQQRARRRADRAGAGNLRLLHGLRSGGARLISPLEQAFRGRGKALRAVPWERSRGAEVGTTDDFEGRPRRTYRGNKESSKSLVRVGGGGWEMTKEIPPG